MNILVSIPAFSITCFSQCPTVAGLTRQCGFQTDTNSGFPPPTCERDWRAFVLKLDYNYNVKEIIDDLLNSIIKAEHSFICGLNKSKTTLDLNCCSLTSPSLAVQQPVTHFGQLSTAAAVSHSSAVWVIYYQV